METQLTPVKRKCVICGKDYYTTRINQKYCSPECSKQASLIRAADRYLRKKENKGNTITSHICPICGKEFFTNMQQKYCSKECAKQAEYRRNKDYYKNRNKEKTSKNVNIYKNYSVTWSYKEYIQGYENLANAIILLAIEDFRKAVRKDERSNYNNSYAKRSIYDCTKFFKSNLFNIYSQNSRDIIYDEMMKEFDNYISNRDAVLEGVSAV